MKKILKTLIYCSLVMVGFNVPAQVPQYSQFYANALYLSPSFTGAEYGTRGFLGARYQWPGLSATYISHAISVDHYFHEINSGVGIIINRDLITPARLRTTDVGISYSYEVGLSRNLIFRPGIQMTYVNRRIDISQLTFGSQYTDDGYIGGPNYEPGQLPSINYLDFAAGGLLVSNRFWLGISLHHLNRPNQSFLGEESLLPAKISYFGGYKIMLIQEVQRRYVKPEDEISISPTFIYKSQGKSDQLDLGVYFRYNVFVTGFWYRSIPVKVYHPDKLNHDALVVLIGMIYKNLNVGYSFDFTTSKLTMETLGSHELTISYRVKSKKRKAIQKRPVCPDF